MFKTDHTDERKQQLRKVNAKENRVREDIGEKRDEEGLGPRKKKEKPISAVTREERVSVLKTLIVLIGMVLTQKLGLNLVWVTHQMM